MPRCDDCGTEHLPEAVYCPGCGTQLADGNGSPATAGRSTAGGDATGPNETGLWHATTTALTAGWGLSIALYFHTRYLVLTPLSVECFVGSVVTMAVDLYHIDGDVGDLGTGSWVLGAVFLYVAVVPYYLYRRATE